MTENTPTVTSTLDELENKNDISIPIVKQNPFIQTVKNADNSIINLFDYFDDPSTNGTVARFNLYETSLAGGIIDVLLFDQEEGTGAPITTSNFLEYVESGDYENTFIHRSAVKVNPNDPTPDDSTNEDSYIPFVVQGGGFTIESIQMKHVTARDPIQNEFSAERSNVRGTIAMAKTSDPDSATSQWFFNVSDNLNLDDPNNPNNSGGFTVFGQVLSEADLAVVDAIAALPVFDIFDNETDPGNVFREVPLLISPDNSLDSDDDFIRFSNIEKLDFPELSFTILNNSNPELVNVSVDNDNQLNIDYQPNQIGISQINLEITNLLGESIEETFTIEVEDFPTGIDSDFNNDGLTDLLWRSGNDNSFPISYLDDETNKIGQNAIINGNNGNIVSLNDNWNAIKGDLIGDSQDDLVLRNKVNGKLNIWQLEQNQIVGFHTITNANNGKDIKVNSNWDLLTGNFVGTAQDDVLLRNKVTNTLAIWEMNGSEVVTNNIVTNGNNGNQVKLNQNWQIVTGNFIGSNQDDMLLQNKINGNLTLWEMNGSEIVNIHQIINANNGNQVKLNQNWQIVTGNFAGSSQDDMLLHNKINGNLTLWEMENNQIVGISNITDDLSTNSSLVL